VCVYIDPVRCADYEPHLESGKLQYPPTEKITDQICDLARKMMSRLSCQYVELGVKTSDR